MTGLPRWSASSIAVAAAMFLSSCGFPEVASSSSSTTATDQSEASEEGASSSGESSAESGESLAQAEIDTEPVWAEMPLALEPIAEIEDPIALAARSGTESLYVAARPGVVWVVERTISPQQSIERIQVLSRPMLDLSEETTVDGERGLLNLTFSSDGRYLFVMFTDLGGTVTVSSFEVARSDTADLESRVDLLTIPQPQANHNGGGLAIGPDGYLYVGLGDGGGAGDPESVGQDAGNTLGTVLRIDPSGSADQPYTVPSGNPFVDGDGAPEVWLTGVRNPWRLSFDELTGDLWIADVGQDQFEEINLLRNADGGGFGTNLGWSEMEGLVTFDGGTEPADHTPPVWVYEHAEGRCSVTGGHVVRSENLPQFDGVYVYGDFCSGELFGLQMIDGAPLVRALGLASPSTELVSFGQDNNGDLFVVESGSSAEGPGRILRLGPVPATDEG